MRRRSTPTVAAAIVAVLTLTACAPEPPRDSSPTPPPAVDAPAPQNEEARRIALGATSAETYRIDGMPAYAAYQRRSDPRFESEFLGDWRIAKKGPVKDREFAQRVAAFITNEESFAPRPTPGTQKTCVFNPDVAFRLRTGDEYTDVIICFSCAQLDVVTSTGVFRLPTVDFDPGYSQLSALAKEAFPNDEDISALR